LPLDKSAALTVTIGSGTVPDQAPDWVGFPGLELEKLTDTGLEFVVLFAKSQAAAVSVCVPFANFAVFKAKVYGLVFVAVPQTIPSTWSWTAATPEPESDAATVTLVVPVNVAPEAGEEMFTIGGVVSGGGLPAARNATICITHPPELETGAVAL